MAPPKPNAQGMRSISSFFAPKSNVVAKRPDDAPALGGKDDPPAKASKANENAAPGATARATAATRDGPTDAEPIDPTPPATASAKKALASKRRRSDASADPPDAADGPDRDRPSDDDDASPSPSDVGRRVAVWWKSERRFFAARVAAVDPKRGKHHVRYDDGDEEWLTLEKHDVRWDAEAETHAGAAGAADDSEGDSDASEGPDPDPEQPPAGRASRVTARRAAAARALERVGGKARRGAAPPPRGRRAKRAVMLSDDSDEDEPEPEPESDDDDASESEFEVESEEESEEDDDDDASDDDFSAEESESAPRKRRKKPAAASAAASARASKKAPPASARAGAASGAGAARADAVTLPPPAPSRPAGAASSVLKNVSGDFGGRPSTAGDSSSPGSALAGPAQYADRERRLFPWLAPERRRDASGRAPSDPLYDPTTLKLPAGFPKCVDADGRAFAVSPGQAQWWRFKASHFDAVVMFKMGKFYELFEMDAHVGAADLGLAYMKGEQPHCGFPEKNYAANAERLARAGHRVVVVEQTETPAQLAARKAATKSKDSVVRREKVAVLTLGTLVDDAMCEKSPEANFVLSIVENSEEPGEVLSGADREKRRVVGVCAADCASGRFLVGAWRDDDARSGLRAALVALAPVEIVAPAEGLSAPLASAARDCAPSAATRRLARGDAGAFASAEGALQRLRAGKYFWREGSDRLPDALAAFATHERADVRDAALGAFGAMTCFLADCMLDGDVLPLGRVEVLEAPSVSAGGAAATARKSDHPGERFVALDAAALEGLEVLPPPGASRSEDKSSLLSTLDRCAGGGGGRLLRRWICRPLRSAAAVAARQRAVADLRGVGLDAVGRARAKIRRAPDAERVVSRLAGTSAGRGRDAANVVLYEDAARAKLDGFLRALEAMKAARDVALAFDDVRGRLTSGALLALVTPEGTSAGVAAAAAAGAESAESEAVGGASMPDLAEALAFFEDAFDWAQARQTGRIAPKPGADQAVDAADERLCEADDALAEWLDAARVTLGVRKGSSEVALVAANKDTHLVEVAERLASSVPGDWQREGKRKGFERFDSPELAALREARREAQEAREEALAGVLRGLVAKFCAEKTRWLRAAEAVAALDALSALAVASDELRATCADVCTPEVVEVPESSEEDSSSFRPFLHASKLRHPCAATIAGGAAFVPNDASLGGDSSPAFLLLTGPNMGGKSTLLRQTCLAAILAHVGADVPAASFRMSAADAVFVRAGAKDDVGAGQSTFMVELGETAAMLRGVTRHSLVALDELGRGTATSDGAAIASAVSDALVRVGCRTLFSTHYHRLADEREGDETRVALGHMGCEVRASGGSGGAEEVTFLYTLTEGACPKSYGVNVARLAGLPESVLGCAARRSAASERAELAGAARAATRAAARGDAEALTRAWERARREARGGRGGA